MPRILHKPHLLLIGGDMFPPEANDRLREEAASPLPRGALRHGTGISHKAAWPRLPFPKRPGCEMLGILLVAATH